MGEVKDRSRKVKRETRINIVVLYMFLGYFYKRSSLVRVLNVYLRQVKVEEHRSGQGQVIKGQLSYSYEYSRVIHLYIYFF